ncbi:UNVERIFIED_CONTAM: hypothetical protein Q9R71_15500 [Actinomycetes bacterium ARC8]|uniref:hypothetical protein n=1 Tax=Glutamicibacter arilaitensis TaxID=256701 RepID=UPI002938C404|nr:hypothetical protein [Actinomycetes bacterium ARC8]
MNHSHQEFSGRSIVVHVSDRTEDLERATRTAISLEQAYPGVQVRIIVNGQALAGMTAFSTDLLPQNTQIGACSLGLGRLGIDPETLDAGIKILPTAPLEIAEAQFNGASYIRL